MLYPKVELSVYPFDNLLALVGLASGRRAAFPGAPGLRGCGGHRKEPWTCEVHCMAKAGMCSPGWFISGGEWPRVTSHQTPRKGECWGLSGGQFDLLVSRAQGLRGPQQLGGGERQVGNSVSED